MCFWQSTHYDMVHAGLLWLCQTLILYVSMSLLIYFV